jgi:hypothetical protein
MSNQRTLELIRKIRAHAVDEGIGKDERKSFARKAEDLEFHRGKWSWWRLAAMAVQSKEGISENPHRTKARIKMGTYDIAKADLRFAYIALLAVVVAGSAVAAKLHFDDEVLYENTQGDVRNLQVYLASCKFCWRSKEARAEIAAIGKRTEMAQREASAYLAAEGDIDRLLTYVNSCQVCIFKSDSLEEIARLARNKALAEQEAKTYQNAHGDIDLLRAYVSSCQNCGLRSDAINEIKTLEQAKLAEQEAITYQNARGSLYSLRTYVNSCEICAYKSEALDEISRLERGELAKQETSIYQNASGDIGRLRAYANSCEICAFKDAALVEIRDLERKANYFSFNIGWQRLAHGAAGIVSSIVGFFTGLWETISGLFSATR